MQENLTKSLKDSRREFAEFILKTIAETGIQLFCSFESKKDNIDRLHAEAEEIIKKRGIINPPDFNKLSREEIVAFVGEYGLIKK